MSAGVPRATFVKGQPEEDAAGSMDRHAFARVLRGLAMEVERGNVKCGMVYVKDECEMFIRATFVKGFRIKAKRT